MRWPLIERAAAAGLGVASRCDYLQKFPSPGLSVQMREQHQSGFTQSLPDGMHGFESSVSLTSTEPSKASPLVESISPEESVPAPLSAGESLRLELAFRRATGSSCFLDQTKLEHPYLLLQADERRFDSLERIAKVSLVHACEGGA